MRITTELIGIKEIKGNIYAYFKLEGFNLVKLEEMKGEKLSIKIDKLSKARTLRQNAYIWKLISEIDLKENALKSEKGEMDIYKNLLKMASIKADYLLATKKAVKKLKETQLFRIVEIVEERGDNLVVKCYYGTSKFTKEEMSNFINATLDYAVNIGLDITGYEFLRN